jgi:hypothetical protein
VTGPYETEHQAHSAVARPGSILPESERLHLLTEACKAAGVDLGSYDARIVRWLAGWDDSTVAVVAGLIERAYRAGRGAHRGGAARSWDYHVRRMPEAEVAAHDASGFHCETARCRDRAVVVAWYKYRASDGQDRDGERFFCGPHAERYAARHHITIEDVPREPDGQQQ